MGKLIGVTGTRRKGIKPRGTGHARPPGHTRQGT